MNINSPKFSDLRATAIYERTLDELNELKEKYEELKENNEELKENNEELKKQLAKFEENNSS